MTSLTVWCHPTPPPLTLKNVVLWEAFLPPSAPDDWISLPTEVGTRRTELRRRYLEWIHDVGVRPRRGRPMRETLEVRPGLSYWWMTTPAANSLAPDSPVYRTVRLMALDLIAEELGATRIDVHASDATLKTSMESLSRRPGRTVRWHGVDTGVDSPTPREAESLKARLVRWLPPIGALSVLLHLRKADTRSPRSTPPETPSTLLMVDYLAHLSRNALNGERFASNYWGPLVDAVEQAGPLTWLHLSPSRPSTTSLAQESALIDSWSDTPGVNHDLLHTGCTRAVRLRALKDYLKIAIQGMLITRKRQLFQEQASGIALWSMFKNDFRNEWYGPTAMLNALYINLFEDYLAARPRLEAGVYLFENQPWEAAFVHAWRKHGHGRLIGFAHSTILFWDTRVFQDARDLPPDQASDSRPWPDLIAVTGANMRRLLLEGGYPEDALRDVEAVRFETTDAAQAPHHRNRLTCLILGEYSWASTVQMLELARPALDDPSGTWKVRLRLHPACSPRWQSPPTWLEMDTEDSASGAISKADVVVCGPLTSAAVEAASRGVPTILAADPQVFPGSPAEDLGALHVYSSADLARALAETLQDQGEARVAKGRDAGPRRRSLVAWVSLLELPDEASHVASNQTECPVDC